MTSADHVRVPPMSRAILLRSAAARGPVDLDHFRFGAVAHSSAIDNDSGGGGGGGGNAHAGPPAAKRPRLRPHVEVKLEADCAGAAAPASACAPAGCDADRAGSGAPSSACVPAGYEASATGGHIDDSCSNVGGAGGGDGSGGGASGPAHWRVVYENIVRMRAARDAPVDSMGAETCAAADAPPAVRR